jgi:hypothetical protein
MLLLGGFAGIGFMAYRSEAKGSINGRLILEAASGRLSFGTPRLAAYRF